MKAREEFLLRNPGVCYEREDSAPAGCSMIEESNKDKVYCDWDGADKAGRKSLNGSGHSLDSCKTACLGNPECMFASFRKDGLCHMFKTCKKPSARSDHKMFKKSCLRPEAEFRAEFWDNDKAYCAAHAAQCKCVCTSLARRQGCTYHVDFLTKRGQTECEKNAWGKWQCSHGGEWKRVQASKACGGESNGTFIKKGELKTQNLEACKLACAKDPSCVAIDYFRDSAWCNKLSKNCDDFPASHAGASNYVLVRPGTEQKDMKTRDECSEACLRKTWCTGFGFEKGMCRLFKERPEKGGVSSGQCYAKRSGCEMHQSTKSDNYCDWDGVDKSGRASLGGGGHTLEECKTACVDRGDRCNFASFLHLTGGCHMFETCNKPQKRTAKMFEKKCQKPWNTRVTRTNKGVLSDFLKDCKSEKREIGLTGHSLGGSVSTWLAIALEKGAYGLPKIPVTRVITYGAPRLVTKNTTGRCPSRLKDRKVAERIINVDFSSAEMDPAPRGMATDFSKDNKFCFESRSLDQHNRYERHSTSYPYRHLSLGNLISPLGAINWANFSWYLHEQKRYRDRTVEHYRGKIGGWDDYTPCVPKEPVFGVEVPLVSCSQCKNGHGLSPYGMACGNFAGIGKPINDGIEAVIDILTG